MKRGRAAAAAVAAAAMIAGLGLPGKAEARGWRGFHGGVFVGGGFWGFDPFWGFGWGPYYGPYFAPYYGPYGASSVDPGVAMMAGYGALDLDVKPGAAEVWVDGKYYAEARDLDGDPSYLWLRNGAHHLVLYKGGYRRFEEDVDVRPGVRELRVRLEKGESAPPGQRTDVASGHEQRSGSGELHLRVQPKDATVYVDGEFRGDVPQADHLRLDPGPHKVELARPGYRTLEREVTVEAGRTVDLDVELERP